MDGWQQHAAGNNQVAPGVYGTLGSPSTANTPGGRGYAAGWTDSSGNFWLFGGSGYPPTGNNNGPLNDLWKFDPATVEWTWMGGSSAIDQPGVFGALQTPAVGVIPGGRQGALSWIDKRGNFWLFAGEGIDAQGMGGFLDDLWEFSPSTGLWAWMGGSSTVGSCFTGDGGCILGQPGVYGTLATPGAANIPGSRTGAINWADSSGNLWLFGGKGFDGKGDYGILNDVWEYQPSTAASSPQDFSVAVSPGSFTVAAGQNVTTTISITPANGFSSSVSFSCSGLPSGASCNFSPSTVTPPGAASTTLTVTTAATTASIHRDRQPLLPIAALGATLFCLGWNKRRRLQMQLLVAFGLIGLGLFNGCAGGGAWVGGGSGSGSAPITSTVTVTASSGSLSHSTTFLLTMN